MNKKFKRLAGFNLSNGFDLIKEDCTMIFEDIRNFADRKVVAIYGDTLSPIIYKPNVDTFEIEFTYMDATDNLFGYNSATFSYENILQEDYNKALEEFLTTCENVYNSLYVENK